MYLRLPKEYPQKSCGVVGCKELLEAPNAVLGSTQVCKGCLVKIEREYGTYWTHKPKAKKVI